MIERWIDVKDNPAYEVSNLGNVRKKSNGQLLRTSLNRKGGYERVAMNGTHKYVHRLVADSFYDGDHSNMDVNHIDGNKLNNNVSNLEWCTRQENIKHAFINGLKYPGAVKVVRCKFCKHRYEFDICSGKDDGFFCSYGERE